MINYSCGSVLVNDQNTLTCDLNNNCLNVGNVIRIPILVTYEVFSFPITYTNAYNQIYVDGDLTPYASQFVFDQALNIQGGCLPGVYYFQSLIPDPITSLIYIQSGEGNYPLKPCPTEECPDCGSFVFNCNNNITTLTITNTTTGEIVHTETYYGNVNTYYDYTILSYGNYSVSIFMSQCGNETAECSYTFKACPFYKIVTDSCHHYTAYDLSPFSKTNYVNIQGVNGYSETYEFTVPYEDHVSFTTPSDGVYTATITHDNYGPCTGTCVNNNGNFDTNLNWWCQGNVGQNENPYEALTGNCNAGDLYFAWSSANSGSALTNQINMSDQWNVLGQSCLTIGKTYCVNFDIVNLNTLDGSYQTSTEVQVYAGDTVITSTEMPQLTFSDTTLTTHHIYIPAITCTNTINLLNNWFTIKVTNNGSAVLDSLLYIDNVCIREVTLAPELQESYTQVIYDLCDMAACIKKLILDLFCNENDPCCNDCDPAKQKQKELYRNELNKLNALYSTFSMMIAKEQADYLNVFTMDSCREMMIAEIQSVFTKINEITKRCGDCDPKTNVTTPSSGCNGC